MGQSWVFFADVSVPAASMAAYLAESASPASYTDWPRDLQTDNAEPMAVADVLDDLAAVEHTDVVRRDDAISVRAIVSGDSDGWLEHRTPLAAAIRAASKHGGRGELAICGWTDGDTRTVLHVTVEPDTSTVKALRGKEATALRKRAYEAVSAIEERIEAAFRKDAIDLPAPLAAIHGGVVDALARVGNEALLAAARQSNVGFTRGKGRGAFRILVEHFPDPQALLDVLRRGFPRMTTLEEARLPAFALEVLRVADASTALEFGRAYLQAGATVFLQREAAAAAIPFADGPRAILAHVHAQLPPFEPWPGEIEITAAPMVEAVVARADAALRAEAREQLQALGENLSGVDLSFAIALGLLVA